MFNQMLRQHSHRHNFKKASFGALFFVKYSGADARDARDARDAGGG